ncbi:hypothetical protein DH2020_041370 [Rehmannia glutinosa]|uniref:Checkpoint protein n=1 Tax=Rehmannia glutinosa TaxID=99300 RepID=A0ABR0UQE2_REHGL
MKFKAFLTDNGINLLEKRILPALDKMGKICHLYFTRDHAFFLHNLLNSDGVQSIAQFKKESLFTDYRISSQNDDKIAFSIDLSLLHRALRSILAIYAESRDFNSNGYKSAVVQDVPISKPLSRADVQELQLALEISQEMPATLVKAPDLNLLQNFVDRMKHVGDVMGVTKANGFRERANGVDGDGNLSAQTRIERAVQRQDAMTVQVSVKHFFKCLQYSSAKPDCAFYGIAPQGACLIVIFQFFIPGTRQTDKSISLHCRLPVLDPGSN